MREVTHIDATTIDDDRVAAPDEEHDQVGTVQVQILLSWFFESSTPADVAIDLHHAA